ncbi:MAG: SDR family oxidoreductase [Alphaproteobacteria bacterium]|nr:SDR family oxidoreductase [Alphaproteobacteria bacterium]
MSEDGARPLAAESRGEAPGRGRLNGRRVLVVGGGQDTRGLDDPPVGNGRAMCVLFAREGARVAVADRGLGAAEASVAQAGSASFAIGANVVAAGDVSAMVATARERLGGLDGLVYNVGIGVGEPWLAGATVESWDRVFAVNIRGAMLTLQAAIPVMAEASSIVLISSIASMKAGSRLPAYDASKAALAGLMRHAGIEGERRGIRVNIVAPGLMDTSIGRAATAGRPGRAKTPVPLGRQGTGWETAYAALFLLSDEAAYITGQVLAVDGGMTGLR